MLMAQWSPDEERLLFIEAERQEKNLVPRYLSLWDGRQTARLSDMAHLGDVAAVAFARGGMTPLSCREEMTRWTFG